MSKLYESITPPLISWIEQQKMFFVGTAPLANDGHVNVSPKGGPSFQVLGPHEVAYQDYTGSGIETAAHVRENGRIVVMFCALEGPPKIVRLHGQGTVIDPSHARYVEFTQLFPPNPGTRAFIHIVVDRVSVSCGFAVPFYEFRGPRDTLDRVAREEGPEQLDAFRAAHNQRSIDGLPGLTHNI